MRAQRPGVALVGATGFGDPQVYLDDGVFAKVIALGAAAVLVGQGQAVEEAVVHTTLFEAPITKGIGDAAIEADEIKVLTDVLRDVPPAWLVVEYFTPRLANSIGRH